MKHHPAMAVTYYQRQHREFGESAFNTEYSSLIFGNEKLAMQNLNRRLASFLEKVLNLESTNHKLELKIKEFIERKAPTSTTDLSKYYRIIEDLQKQIITRSKENHQVVVSLDNTKLAANDFRVKFESERTLTQTVEADVVRLRMFLGEIKMTIKDLDLQMSGLKEELVFLKKSHEEDLHMFHTQSGSVNVEVDCAPAVDLSKVLLEMREQYEALNVKNKNKIEQWYMTKVSKLKTDVLESHTEIKTSQTVVSDLQKTYQSLEIEVNGIHRQLEILQQDLVQVGVRYSEKLSQLQMHIYQLQTEVEQITTNIKEQATQYNLLLDIKMRLELEIAEYRRLLGGEHYQTNIYEVDTSKTTTVSTKVTETVVEEKKEVEVIEDEHHLHQRRVKVIVENLVDGVVVSSSIDEKVEDLAA